MPTGIERATRAARRVSNRSRTGCATCRNRHRKCDETRPQCLQCLVEGIECEGYSQRLVWKNYTTTDMTLKPSRPRDPSTRSPVEIPISPTTPNTTSSRPRNDVNPSCAFQEALDTLLLDHSPHDQYFGWSPPPNFEAQILQESVSTSYNNTNLSNLDDATTIGYVCPDINLSDFPPITEDQVADPAGQCSQHSFLGSLPLQGIAKNSILSEDLYRPNVSLPKNRSEHQTYLSEPIQLSPCVAPNLLFDVANRIGFEYFVVKMCGLTVAFDDESNNPYRSRVLPHCFQDERLMYAVLAISELHRAKTCKIDPSRAVAHRRRGLQLAHKKTDQSTSTLSHTLTLFILSVVFEMYDRGQSVDGLIRFKSYVKAHGGMSLVDSGSSMVDTGFHGACILAASLNRGKARELLEISPLTTAACMYGDETNEFGVTETDPSHPISTIPPPFTFESFWGSHEDIFGFIASIARFASILRSHAADSRDALLSNPKLLTHALKLENMVQEWEPSSDLAVTSPSRAISVKSSMVFRDATLLYLYREIWDARTTERRVQSVVERIFRKLDEIESTNHINTCFIWPLFVVGCELLDPQRQAMVTSKLKSIHEACENGSALLAVDILNRVWDLRGGNGPNAEMQERLDWPGITEGMGKGQLALF